MPSLDDALLSAIPATQRENARVGGDKRRIQLAQTRQRVGRLRIAAEQDDDGMAGDLLMMERHGLAALILQDRRGREIADAELGWWFMGASRWR
jgi:hypothetical protein